MTSYAKSINEQYGRGGGLLEQVLAGLDAVANKKSDKTGTAAAEGMRTLQVDDLAPMDGFHSRGRQATVELCHMVPIAPTDRVIDIGCGPGGTARYLASTFQCQVSGVDLTREYVTVGNQLNEIVGLNEKIDLVYGSALSLPFEDNAFDVAWTEHVVRPSCGSVTVVSPYGLQFSQSIVSHLSK